MNLKKHFKKKKKKEHTTSYTHAHTHTHADRERDFAQHVVRKQKAKSKQLPKIAHNEHLTTNVTCQKVDRHFKRMRGVTYTSYSITTLQIHIYI